MNKVKTMQEAYRVFDLLGIKEVTKEWQRKKGTEVWELPQRTIFYNGHGEINRFTIYRNGYIRKMVVYGKNSASKSCYQLNRVRKVANFVKDYKWSDLHNCNEWTGKYRKIYNNERIMIDNHRDRVVYLCNYLLKNYYRKMDFVGEYTVKRMKMIHGEWWRNERKIDTLQSRDEDDKFFSSTDDVQVIINGHRYNLS
tara:strand:+ start:781 stop:1371 length:591 start_codon:yes stop_codon:yes gene_type:complete